MNLASSLLRRRRVLVLCAVTVLLHYLTIGWVTARIGTPLPDAAPEEPAVATIVAQLHAPAPAEPAPVAAPVRTHRPHKVVAKPPAPVAPEPAPQAVPEPAPTPPEPAVQPEAANSEPGPEDAAPPPPPPVAQGYRAIVPPSAVLSLDVAHTDAGGVTRNGSGRISWETDGARYALKVEAGYDLAVTRLNLLVLTSEGTVGQGGFEPVEHTEKRFGRSATATHFNREVGAITFSATPAMAPLASGAQDKATLPLQLAAIARADPGQFDGGLDITVGEDKDAAEFQFKIVAREEIETKLGSMVVWHLRRPPRPGFYSSQIDVWLAPSHGWLPVQIRNTEASGAVTTQTVTHILVKDTEK